MFKNRKKIIQKSEKQISKYKIINLKRKNYDEDESSSLVRSERH